METLQETKEVKLIKPADRWVYCKKGDVVCYENIILGRNFVVSFEKPILEIAVDKHIAVRTENEVALIDFEGKVNIIGKRFFVLPFEIAVWFILTLFSEI